MYNKRNKTKTEQKVFKSQQDMPANCPPDDAIERCIDPAYRFLEGNNIQEKDFLNHLENNRPYKDKCDAIALSFFTDLEALESLKKKFKRFKRKKILMGKIEPEFGISNIRNKHINLWLYEDVLLLKDFKGRVIEGEDK